MKIVTKIGNLLDIKSGWMVHGANAGGVMGSGVAVAIKNKYPECFRVYREQYENHGLNLGTNVLYSQESLVIVNAITQQDCGSDGKRYVSYDAIETCFNELNRLIPLCIDISPEIHIPFLGAGLGGGSWNIIKAIIEDTVDFPVTVWSINGKMPDGSQLSP